ncbi:MAG: aryl-sulfate sulfotransferase [Bryobacteraceae bacterium]
MNAPSRNWAGWGLLLAALASPAFASVRVTALKPSRQTPQPIGTPVTFTATATDSASGPLTFQFNVAAPNHAPALVRDFNAGTLSGGTWTSQPFVWVPSGPEGTYQIQVVAKDFSTGMTATGTVQFTLTPLVTGSSPVVKATANALVALFSAPACAVGSQMRVSFQIQTQATPAVTTNYAPCRNGGTMNFEIAGMYPSTTYTMFSETDTTGKIKNGPTVTFTTGALPKSIKIPSFTVEVPPKSTADTADSVLLINTTQLGDQPLYPNLATDLTGKIQWYYSASPSHGATITHPLANATYLTIEYGKAWNTLTQNQQIMRQIDLAGNVIKETNTGVVQQELLALGAVDGGPCNVFASPAPVGSACLDTFSHDAIQYTVGSDQYTAVLCDIEKIFPIGTQGDTSGLPVDVRGAMIVVLNSDWQAVWYWDNFDPDGGGNGYPQLPISQVAALNESCGLNEEGCEGIQLLGAGISPLARDWVHENSIYYWATDTSGGASGAFVWSSRNQDLVTKVDYNNGTGTKDILWTMGACSTDFTFNNIYGDPWPWFSGQHYVAIQNSGAGPMTVFDDGNTRVSSPGASKACLPGVGSGNSRGMALTVDETSMTVSPLLSANLGFYSPANGASGMLSNGNYFFLNPVVLLNLETNVSYSVEILPAAGSENGTQVYNIQGPEAYRAWRMPSLYQPPTI